MEKDENLGSERKCCELYSTPMTENGRKLNRYPLKKEGDKKEARKVQ